MLRIEKPTTSKPPAVSLRESSRLLTPLFLRALALAACLHLCAFILFQVQPFRIRHANTQFPPVQVKIDLAPPDSEIFAELAVESPRQGVVPEPKWPAPIILPLSLNSSRTAEIFLPKEPLSLSPFVVDTHEELARHWIHLEPAAPSKRATPQLGILGQLADRPIVIATVPEPSLSGENVRIERVLYAVKVDDATGKIFWYASQLESVDKKIKKKAEAILEALQFKPEPEGFVTTGEVELYLSRRKR